MSDSVVEKTVLVTGGGGYIGSHCILQLLEHKFKVIAIDNFENAAKGKLVCI
jgi:UDP-glucose 4-epimerase